MERVDIPASVCEMVNIYTDVGHDVTPLPQHAWGGYGDFINILCIWPQIWTSPRVIWVSRDYGHDMNQAAVF